VAGAVNSIAGGGTLFTFPSLLAIGVAPLTANGTSTVALVPGSAAAVVGYWKEVARTRLALWFCLPSLAGGGLGAWLSMRAGDRLFAATVPWLILAGTLLFMLQNVLRRRLVAGSTAPAATGARLAGLLAVQLLVSIYGGFFGAGMGILILATLAHAGFHDVHEMNGLKNVMAVCINGIAALTFIAGGRVAWMLAGLMAAGAIAGGYAGARVARRLSQTLVRRMIVFSGLVLTAWTFVRG
jgi:uncharacterized membrane protein YfcA